MDWHRITSQHDIDELMQVFNGFRHCVLTEMDYVSGAYVQPALAMYPINAKRRLRFVFQRQDTKLPAIELVFDELERLNLIPASSNCTAEIAGVLFKFQNGKLYWSDNEDFDINLIGRDPVINKGSWLMAKKAQWRTLEHHLGPNIVYGVTK